MRQTINALLLSLGEEVQENRMRLKVDMAIYQKLVKELPRLFPMPDEFYTKTATASDYDAALIYVVKDNEHPEALRIILSLMFGFQDWEIEIEKVTPLASLYAIKRYDNYTLLVKIVCINAKEFEYEALVDTGSVLHGPVKCSKFVSLETPRADVTPEVFMDQLTEISYCSFLQSKQAYICSLASQVLPKQLPLPDAIIPALGLSYDLDFTYSTDTKNRLRSIFDKLLGYAGWSAILDKKTGSLSLHTIISVPCREQILKLRLNILNVTSGKEQLFLVADLKDQLIYRAIRSSDPDYQEVSKMFGMHNDGSS